MQYLGAVEFAIQYWELESKANSHFVSHLLVLTLSNMQFYFHVSVWQKLEEENQEFFKAYYLRLLLKEQITEFNRLLQEHAKLSQLHPTEVASLPNSNGSHVSECKSLLPSLILYPSLLSEYFYLSFLVFFKCLFIFWAHQT